MLDFVDLRLFSVDFWLLVAILGTIANHVALLWAHCSKHFPKASFLLFFDECCMVFVEHDAVVAELPEALSEYYTNSNMFTCFSKEFV